MWYQNVSFFTEDLFFHLLVLFAYILLHCDRTYSVTDSYWPIHDTIVLPPIFIHSFWFKKKKEKKLAVPRYIRHLSMKS